MKILVHLHLFYQEMLSEMLSNISNLKGLDYDLYVTVINPSDETMNTLLDFNSEVKIINVENRGYDVAPFIKVLKMINLDDYDFVIKIHTKQTLKTRARLVRSSFKKDEWRKLLISFMESSERIDNVLNIFAENPKVGMISHYNLIIKASNKEDPIAKKRAEEIIRHIDVVSKKRMFVAGTMFIVRAKLLKWLQEYPCATEDFEPYVKNIKGGSLAHVYERLFGYVVTVQGYEIVSCVKKSFFMKCISFIYRSYIFILRSLIQVKINRENKLIVKICKIPICSLKLK